MTALLHAIAAGLYLIVGVIGRVGARNVDAAARTTRRRVTAGLGIGVVVHGLAFVAIHAGATEISLESFAAALSLIGWLVPMVYLLSLRVARVPEVGSWVAFLAGGFSLAALAGLALSAPAASPPAAGGTWSHAHVLLSTLGFSLLMITSMAGIAYLAKERALKSKRVQRIALPSLESLDRLEHVTLSLGFSLLTLGVVSGFVWGLSRGVTLWTYHSAALVVAWSIYLLPVGMRVARREHGDRPARVVVVGFGVLAFSYLGIRVLGLAT